jgi:hypothetical protein
MIIYVEEKGEYPMLSEAGYTVVVPYTERDKVVLTSIADCLLLPPERASMACYTDRSNVVSSIHQALSYIQVNTNNVVRFSDIAYVTCDVFGVTIDQMQSKSRKRKYIAARQVCQFLARTLKMGSLNEVGKRFGGTDHAGVLHNCKAVKTDFRNDAGFRDDVRKVIRLLLPDNERRLKVEGELNKC